VYGFHKVPHLNDGALHTENAPEVWEFTNEHFTKDNPDLLTIVRKKNEAERARSARRQGSPDAQPRPATGYPAIEATNKMANSADMAVIYEEMCNIKRLQGSVITELARLKRDNEALWTEAAEARARYDQQQLTLNKMLQFLSTIISPNKNNAPTIAARNRNLLTGPPAYEELNDDPVESVLTPETQSTGDRDLSNLFAGAQPILPANASDAAWWQNLVGKGNDSGLFLGPVVTPATSTSATTPNDTTLAHYEPPPAPLQQHRSSLAAMEQAVDQTDQSIGRISNLFGINNWDNYNLTDYQDPTTEISPTEVAPTANIAPDYSFDDFLISNLPSSPLSFNFLDPDEQVIEQPQVVQAATQTSENPEPRIQTLSREVTPKRTLEPVPRPPINHDGQQRKRTRSQSQMSPQGAGQPLSKRGR